MSDAFGLSAAELALYQSLVERGTATVEELAKDWAFAEPLDAVLSTVVGAGLAYRTGDAYTAVAPRAALDGRLAGYRARLRAARAHADRLAREYPPSTPVVESVSGTGAVRERIRSARTELRVLARSPFLDADPGDLPARLLYD